ncbi:hypothetical protein SPRG_09796 [Saprolegnia parasitica CBS 223.65]|uniref:sphingomyelin phosphodiesterase n=1 Tax=Saprolegnia parasitica (strain CBS 223.65) TaxID=695850 RepID=A0A067CC57_SAPPC|nr:hypothetical protein SPRG_09796 [Saprolegnia parasitica CBS 223.65]KDO24407.1 hypothetical protein SPRG_09796 [Saprolegnia parasitica CBS 223.65]|eukprot:XP_012204837.1 hypothetical protein SPRG_09796 [Saprolegnia parasitica CBS 223.65]
MALCGDDDPPVEAAPNGVRGIKPLSGLTKMWSCANAEIGVVGAQIAQVRGGFKVYYEVHLSFPDAHKQWTVRRSYREFSDLHATLHKTFGRKLDRQSAVFPKQARVEWAWSQETRCVQAARRLKLKLNAYLHRLLELHDVHTSPIFRAFFDFRDQDVMPTSSLTQLDLDAVSPLSSTDSTSSSVNDVGSASSATISLSSLPSTASTSSSSASLTSQPTSLPRRASDTTAFRKRGNDKQLASTFSLGTQTSANLSALDPIALKALHDRSLHTLPPPSRVVKTTSDCPSVVLYGQSISLRAHAGLVIGLHKRSAWSGSQRVGAVAAVAAGITFLSGPIGITIGALGSLGKHHLSKTYSLGTSRKEAAKYDEFRIQIAEAFSSPSRPVQYGDCVRLLNVHKHQYVRITVPSDSKRGYLTADSSGKGTVFKCVSPLGYRGPVVCGSPLCLQVADAASPWYHDLIAIHKDYVTTDGSPAIFKLGIYNHPCMANDDIAMTVARPMPRSVTVRVAVYNVWLMPPIVTTFVNVSAYKTQRALAIPKALAASTTNLPDVIVFCEAFDVEAKALLASGMKQLGYLYETRVAGERSNMKALMSGVFAMSRYPIAAYDELLFGGTSLGDDKAADKAAIYFELHKGGEVIHIVGTHLQAWESPGAVATRKKQMAMMMTWLDAKMLPKRDALLFAGDFNIDKMLAEPNEFDEMLERLHARDADLAEGSSPFSFDPFTNVLASSGISSGGKQERLDYVMYSSGHREPHAATARVLPLKALDGWPDVRNNDRETLVMDLSDHYPVLGEFTFG